MARTNRTPRPLYSNNTSGYKGVTWSAPNKKWRAKIQVRGKVIDLGLWNDPIHAAKQYDHACVAVWRNHAVTNKSLGLL